MICKYHAHTFDPPCPRAGILRAQEFGAVLRMTKTQFDGYYYLNECEQYGGIDGESEGGRGRGGS